MEEARREIRDRLGLHLFGLPDEYRKEIAARLIERGTWETDVSPGVMDEKLWDESCRLVGPSETTRMVIGICEEPPREHL